MSRDEYLDLLEKEGLLKEGVRSGAINYVHVKHAEIRKEFASLKPQFGYTASVCKLAYKYKLSETQIKSLVR